MSGLTEKQTEILLLIGKRKISVRGLMVLSGMTNRAIHQHLDALERKGWIRTSTHPRGRFAYPVRRPEI